MCNKREQVEKLATLLKSNDMSGFDVREHGDYDENVAEYLINSGVSVDPVEVIKIKNLSTLEKLIHDAMSSYLDYLEDLDQKGLIDNRKKSAFIAQYVADHSSEDGGAV